MAEAVTDNEALSITGSVMVEIEQTTPHKILMLNNSIASVADSMLAGFVRHTL